MGALVNTPEYELASWSGLLHDALARCEATRGLAPADVERYRELLGSDSAESWVLAAEAITMGLGGQQGGEFARWLRETVGSFASASRRTPVLEAIRALSERGVVLATVNYDSVLEHATGLPPVSWRDRSKVERVLRGDDRGILHLHGYWEDPPSVVLGVRSYDDVVEDEHASTVLRSLRLTRTLLFVGHGAGLGDPNWSSLLKWTEATFEHSEYRHYRLALEHELRAFQAKHPSPQRIFPLGYGSKYDDLGPFLRSLVPEEVPSPPRQPASLVPEPKGRWVILRVNIVQPNYDRVEEAEALARVEDADAVRLEFSYEVARLAHISPRDWRAIARGLDRLVADAKAVDEPSRFSIVGRGPLPAFAYLGAKMARMGPVVFFNKFRQNWERYDSPERCPRGGSDDATIEAPALGYDPVGRLAIALHTSKEYPDQERSIAVILEAESMRLAGTYRIQNRAFSHRDVPLTPAELPVYLQHLEAALDWRKREFPEGDGGLVVALACPAWLAYWVGHRLNPNVTRGRIDFPNYSEQGYARAMSYPMHLAPWLAGKARLLLMNAEPDDQVRVRGHVNFDTIKTALRRELGDDGPFELEFCAALRVREFMREVEKFKPDILHLHLHGGETGELAFEDGRGETAVVGPEQFVDMLRATEVKPALIVLSACYSATLAPSLLGIAECVIAMKSKTNTNRAIDFAHFFYEALARGNNLAQAINQGKAGAGAKGVDVHILDGVKTDQVVLLPG